MDRVKILKSTVRLACLMAVAGCASGPDIHAPAKTVKPIDPAVAAANMCGSPAAAAAKGGMPLVDGLAPVHYPVTSSDPKVQAYVDQGFALLYGFEYPLAKRSFAAARAIDPDCAMCAWGEAVAMGPNINSGDMLPADRVAALALVDKALTLPNLPEADRALLQALARRYAANAPAGQRGVHAEDFAESLMQSAERWPDNDIIAILAAEAAMNVRPWDYWEADGKTPLPWAARAIAQVERVLARSPDQPEAIHLYIHLTEASTTPERAEKYADRLGILAPQSAHLVHMPSHTYYRLGRFDDGVRVNIRAVELDEAMARRVGADPKFYGYFFHHTTFIMSAASQIGDQATAMRMAAQLDEATPLEKTLASPRLQGIMALTLQARQQFLSPAEILALKAPDKRLRMIQPFWHAARAQAFAAAGDVAAARREVDLLQKARKTSGATEEILIMERLADETAQGRVAAAAHDYASAAAHFRAASDIEKTLPYNEPPFAGRPAEVALGGVLLRSGDTASAKAAFERALAVRPGNGWAMWGLAQSEMPDGDRGGAKVHTLAFEKIWRGDRLPTLDSL